MTDTAYSINQKSSIMLSRNTPVALVVGAAGFIGSNITEALLKKNIQVIGVDNLSTGNKNNLKDATKDNNFHLIISDGGEDFGLDISRLDYIFIVTGEGLNLDRVLDMAKQFNSKIVFISSIEAYDRKSDLKWLRISERKLAEFSGEHKLNARVVRLAPVFGPRMHFEVDDPIIRLIQATVLEELQKESIALNFSSRALYIDDVVDLILKSMFSGSTALKIFDGARLSPVKVMEVKQVLLDPVWHENRNFQPSELPPWPTPNLEKTMKNLAWHPQTGLVRALKETLVFFKENEIKVPELEKEPLDQKIELSEQKKELLQELKQETKSEKIKNDPPQKINFKFVKASLFVHLMAIILIFYAIVYPAATLGYGLLSFKTNLQRSIDNLSKGHFKESMENIERADRGIKTAGDLISSLEVFSKVPFLKKYFDNANDFISQSNKVTGGAKDIISGTEELYKGLKAMTGETVDQPTLFFDKSAVHLTSAENKLTEVYLKLHDKRIGDYLNLVRKAKVAAVILPKISEDKKSYLVLLQNNMELRPTGGFIGSVARVDFEGGKLKKIEVQDIYALDGGLNLPVEPPKELKSDLGVKSWYLRDSNWEPDFPTSARQAEWFYNKETGLRVDGVVALDLTGMADLLSVVGSLELSDYGEKIDSGNLFDKSITYAEASFFPGTEAKKNFLNSLLTALFNKMFFVPQNNWPGITGSIGKSFEGKHFQAYLNDPKLFSYIDSLNFSGTLPRPSEKKLGEIDDFLGLVEANLGANKSNYYLDRKINLETGIGKEGEVTHRLRVSYSNRSPSEVWPAGKYKNRQRIYLPFGTKLVRALWGEKDITKDVTSFVDYGRTGYSFLIELGVKEQKTLVLDWELGNKLTFDGKNATYRLDIIKQAGTLKDPLEWNLTFPINYKLELNKEKSGPQEYHIITDLSEDRRFEVKFSK